MRKFVFVAILTILASMAYGQTYVNGYFKSDGTYVQGHYKTTPNNTVWDNYSTVGNVNPYTSQVGTVQPTTFYYSVPSATAYTNTNSTRTYYVGPRGGVYYINSNGNKTYVPRS